MRLMQADRIRWGIISTGAIAKTFARIEIITNGRASLLWQAWVLPTAQAFASERAKRLALTRIMMPG